jgi:hypothetical protein
VSLPSMRTLPWLRIFPSTTVPGPIMFSSLTGSVFRAEAPYV